MIFQFNLELTTLLLCSIILPFHQVALANIFPAVRQSSNPDYSNVPSLIICFQLADETSLQSDSVVTLNPRTSCSTSEITGRWSSFTDADVRGLNYSRQEDDSMEYCTQWSRRCVLSTCTRLKSNK